MKRMGALLLTILGCMALASEASAAEAPPPSVSVDGVANVAISQYASSTEADAVYREGLTAAIKDGLGKADFLATATGATVGAVQQILERGSSVECVSPSEEGSGTEYASYDGAQPDSGSFEASSGVFSGASAPLVARAVVSHPTAKKKHKKKHHRPVAKKSSTSAKCTLSTQVELTYLLG
jgi:hypothetical protein